MQERCGCADIADRSELENVGCTIDKSDRRLQNHAMTQSENITCAKCKTNAEPGAVFCTGCGTRLPEPATSAGGDGTATVSGPLSQPPAQAAAASAIAAAAQPAYEPAQGANSYSPTAFGQAPAGRKTGGFVIVALVLLIAVAGAVLWLRASAHSPRNVLILAPVQSSITVEPNSTTELGVAVQGDGGAGISWVVQESYGGRVEPAGVTAQGQQIIYKAAYRAGGTPGDYHVVATSAADKQSQVAITVHVER